MRERFLRVREVRRELKKLKSEISDFSEFLYLPSTSLLDGVEKCNGGAKKGVLEALIKRSELEEKYDERLRWFLVEKERLENMLARVGENEAAVVREYYLRGRTWREVSEVLELSESWMFKLHKRAFKTLKESITS